MIELAVIGRFTFLRTAKTNDYFDYKKGMDTEDRLGPVGITQSVLRSAGTGESCHGHRFRNDAAVGGYIWFCNLGRVWMLLPLASLPLALKQIRLIWQKPGGPILNQVLAATAILALFFSLLLSLGLILSAN